MLARQVLENASRTGTFTALLLLLRLPPAPVTAGGSEARARFSDLVVKCLIKLTRTLGASLAGLDVSEAKPLQLPVCCARLLWPGRLACCLAGDGACVLHLAVRPPQVLLTIHGYFMTLSVDEIKRRSQEDDRPLRMVKTVLYELTKARLAVRWSPTSNACVSRHPCSR